MATDRSKDNRSFWAKIRGKTPEQDNDEKTVAEWEKEGAEEYAKTHPDSPASANIIQALRPVGEVIGRSKEGWNMLQEEAGLPVSTTADEQESRELYADSPYAGNVQASIKDFAEHPNLTNAIGMPLSVLGMMDKPAGQIAKAAGAGPQGQALAEITSGFVTPVGISKLSKLSKLKNVINPLELQKLLEASKLAGAEGNAARAAINATPEIAEAARVAESQRIAGSPLKRRFSPAENAPQSNPTQTVGPLPITSPERRAASQVPGEVVNTGPSLKNKYGAGEVGAETVADDAIAAPPPDSAPIPASEPAGFNEPQLQPQSPAPASGNPAVAPVSTPPTGTTAQPGFWDRGVGGAAKNTAKTVAKAAVPAGVGYYVGKGVTADQAATAKAKPAEPPIPTKATPTSVQPAQVSPAGGPTDTYTPPSEQDIYDQSQQDLGNAQVQNLERGASGIADAREGQEVDPRVQERLLELERERQAEKDTIAKGEKYTPSTGERILAGLANGLGAWGHIGMVGSQALDSNAAESRAERDLDLKTAGAKVNTARSGVESAMAAARERNERGRGASQDAVVRTQLRNQAMELARNFQAERDPRRKQELAMKMKQLQSQIDENDSKTNYYNTQSRADVAGAKAYSERLNSEFMEKTLRGDKQQTK